jgi:hypothetical protein
MKTLTITYNPETKFCPLTHPYSKRFVAYVSQGVKPLSYRRYDEGNKRWEVHAVKVPQVVAAARRYFDHVDYKALPPELQISIVQYEKGKQSGAAYPVSGGARLAKSPHAILFVAPDAPQEVIKAAYRALASKYHPDHGGDPEAFRKIDEAYKELKKG